MTTLAALMGTFPIALGLGAGAESRQPLGLAVVGGLLFSQFLTLFVTPVFFVTAERFRGRRGAVAVVEPPTTAQEGAQGGEVAADEDATAHARSRRPTAL